MPRLGHGQIINLSELEAGAAAMASLSLEMRRALVQPLRDQLQPFDFLFPDLQDAADLLPESPQTIQALKDLAAAMTDTQGGQANSGIPAVYTYLGQFIDHDITLEATDATAIAAPNLAPLSKDEIPLNTKNQRSSALDLDSAATGEKSHSITAAPG